MITFNISLRYHGLIGCGCGELRRQFTGEEMLTSEEEEKSSILGDPPGADDDLVCEHCGDNLRLFYKLHFAKYLHTKRLHQKVG